MPRTTKQSGVHGGKATPAAIAKTGYRTLRQIPSDTRFTLTPQGLAALEAADKKIAQKAAQKQATKKQFSAQKGGAA